MYPFWKEHILGVPPRASDCHKMATHKLAMQREETKLRSHRVDCQKSNNISWLTMFKNPSMFKNPKNPGPCSSQKHKLLEWMVPIVVRHHGSNPKSDPFPERNSGCEKTFAKLMGVPFLKVPAFFCETSFAT